jgi:CubicO group peptidase (beta-lactamase class C family)
MGRAVDDGHQTIFIAGQNLSKADLGYGYQWWLPFNNDGDFIGLGIYGQFIYVYPKYGTVIVKTSAYANYNTDGAEKICQTIELFRELAKKM